MRLQMSEQTEAKLTGELQDKYNNQIVSFAQLYDKNKNSNSNNSDAGGGEQVVDQNDSIELLPSEAPLLSSHVEEEGDFRHSYTKGYFIPPPPKVSKP